MQKTEIDEIEKLFKENNHAIALITNEKVLKLIAYVRRLETLCVAVEEMEGHIHEDHSEQLFVSPWCWAGVTNALHDVKALKEASE